MGLAATEVAPVLEAFATSLIVLAKENTDVCIQKLEMILWILNMNFFKVAIVKKFATHLENVELEVV